MSDALLTREDVAKRLRISLRSFALHVRPELQPIRIGRRVLFREEEVAAWVDRQQGGPSDREVESCASASRLTGDRSSAARATASAKKNAQPKLQLVSTPTRSESPGLSEPKWRRALWSSGKQRTNG
jgi:predicted DNA-binding transcriptional regulator AlpA